jgi:flagellar hook-length control protein FliK
MNESNINLSSTFNLTASQSKPSSLLQSTLLSVKTESTTRFDQVLSEHQSAASLVANDTTSSKTSENSITQTSSTDKVDASQDDNSSSGVDAASTEDNSENQVSADKTASKDSAEKAQVTDKSTAQATDSKTDNSSVIAQDKSNQKATKLASKESQSGNNLPVEGQQSNVLAKQTALKKKEAAQDKAKKLNQDASSEKTDPTAAGAVPLSAPGIDPHKTTSDKLKLAQESHAGKSVGAKNQQVSSQPKAPDTPGSDKKTANASGLTVGQHLHQTIEGLKPGQPTSGEFVLGQASPQKSTTSVNVAGNQMKPVQGQKTAPVMNQLKTGEVGLKKGAKSEAASQSDLFKTLSGEKGGVVDHTADAAGQAAQANSKPLDGGGKGTNAMLKGYATSVNVPVGQPGWSEGVTNKVVWLTKHQFHLAEIHLDPPELGPVDIKIKMHHDQASISFNSPHAHVRDLLESSMPKLREMMAQNGVALGDVDVSSQQNFQGQSFSMGGDASGSGSSGRGGALGGQDDGVGSELETPVQMSRISMDRMVDYYA